MKAIGIKHWLATAWPKIETRARAGAIAGLVGAAVIGSSLATTTAYAQGAAGSGLQQSRKNAEQRRAATHRLAKPAERAAAQRAKERQHMFLNTAKRAERAAAQSVKKRHRRR